MGDRSPAPFESEEAQEWLADLEEVGMWAVSQAFKRVLNVPDDESPDAWDSACAVAAAEVVATLLGVSTWPANERVAELLGSNPPTLDGSFQELAAEALRRVHTRSGLRERWQAEGDLDRWLAAMQAMERALR